MTSGSYGACQRCIWNCANFSSDAVAMPTTVNAGRIVRNVSRRFAQSSATSDAAASRKSRAAAVPTYGGPKLVNAKRMCSVNVFEMRATAAVNLDRARACWDVFRYDDVKRVLSDHKAFSSNFAGDGGQDGSRAAVRACARSGRRD